MNQSENKNKPSDDRYFSTEDFYLACFLFAKGIQLVNVDNKSERKSSFVFANDPRVVELLAFFDFEPIDSKHVLVDPRQFITAIKSLKSKLYRDRNGSE